MQSLLPAPAPDATNSGRTKMRLVEAALRIRSLNLVCATTAGGLLERLKSKDGREYRVGLRKCVVRARILDDRRFVISLRALTGRSYGAPKFFGAVVLEEDSSTRVVGSFRLPVSEYVVGWLLGSLTVENLAAERWDSVAPISRMLAFVGIAVIFAPVWTIVLRVLAVVGWNWKMAEIERLLKGLSGTERQ